MAKRKKSRRKVSVFTVIYWIIVIALILTIGFVIKNIISLHLEKNRLEKEEQELLNTKEELNAELENVDDLEYIEEQARKLLKMIKPGEVLYILDGDNPNPDQETDQETTQEETVTETQEVVEETWEEPVEEVVEETPTEEWTEETTWEEPVTEESTWEESAEQVDTVEDNWDYAEEDTGIVAEDDVDEFVEEDVEE